MKQTKRLKKVIKDADRRCEGTILVPRFRIRPNPKNESKEEMDARHRRTFERLTAKIVFNPQNDRKGII